MISTLLWLISNVACLPLTGLIGPTNDSAYAEIQVVDEENGRPIPLAELETVNGLRFVTDNAGRIAFHEPGLMDTEIYFSVKSHGYTYAKDGFGFSGVKLTPLAGKVSTIKLHRNNIAVRLCRLTGEGLFRDSQLLGYKFPNGLTANQGRVAGQDSVQATIYENKVVWLCGDTQRIDYPLGLYRTAGATTPLFAPDQDLSQGISYQYLVDLKTNFARAMMPLPERSQGVIWIFGLFVVPDSDGKERLLGHYSRREGLHTEFEQGIAMFDDDTSEFRSITQFPLEDTWRHPTGHPILHKAEGKTWILFGSPCPNVRVPATMESVLDPSQYEAFTCEHLDKDGHRELNSEFDGTPRWRWQRDLPPVDSETERRWVDQQKLTAEHTRFLPTNVPSSLQGAFTTGKPQSDSTVILHRGSVRWNAFRQKWIMIAGQIHGHESMLGEVWYSEAKDPCGPFRRAVKIATHDKQTFYNVCQHAFLDQQDGKVIFFEGTYTNDFSGNPDKTPRYNYNQVLYQLNLDDPKLDGAKLGDNN